MKASPTTKENKTVRPPVVVVMGHIDHGKSTLLDYIRKTNVVDKEVGGITQKMSAYEVIHKFKSEGKEIEQKISFLDTPGHESFNAVRARGASAADIAILVVSAEDGFKPQTLDALKAIKTAGLPYIVGISKIDKENANIERTKQSLAENEVYVEGYGGSIPFVPFSGKTGNGVPELMDMILLVAEMEQFTADANKPAEGIVIEAIRDKVMGISATLIIKDGSIKTGNVLVAGKALSTVRIIENYLGKQIKSAGPSEPVRVVGWTEMPEVGGPFISFENKKLAEKYIEEMASLANDVRLAGNKKPQTNAGAVIGGAVLDANDEPVAISMVPILIKADNSGSLAALEYEISKIKQENVELRIVSGGVGDITENDIKVASAVENTLIVGFNVKTDGTAKNMADRSGLKLNVFNIIYKMTEWLTEVAKERAPKISVVETKGRAKVLKIFSVTKDKQVLGARVEEGSLFVNDEVRIFRREAEIAKGRVRELQKAKSKVGEVTDSTEFGAMIECKIEIAAGDKIEAFHIVTK